MCPNAKNLINIYVLGSTYLDEHNETTLAVLHWKEAHKIRSKNTGYIGNNLLRFLPKFLFNISFFKYETVKEPLVPSRLAYGNISEFTTLTELDHIAGDVDAMRIQSLLICERVLGIQHTDTLFRLMFR